MSVNIREYFGLRQIVPGVVGILIGLTLVPVWLSRKPPIEMLGIQIMNPIVDRGEKLTVRYGYKVLRPCNSTIHLDLYDRVERVRMYEGALDETIAVPEDAGPDVYMGIVKSVGVPIHSKEGSGYLQGVITHRCNALHDWWPIVQDLPMLSFTIETKEVPEPVKKLERELEDLKSKVEQQGLPAQLPPSLQILPAGPGPVPPAADPTGPVGPDKEDSEGAPGYKPKARPTPQRARQKKENKPVVAKKVKQAPTPQVMIATLEPQWSSEPPRRRPRREEEWPTWLKALFN
jgi:hypothetical protein